MWSRVLCVLWKGGSARSRGMYTSLRAVEGDRTRGSKGRFHASWRTVEHMHGSENVTFTNSQVQWTEGVPTSNLTTDELLCRHG